LITGGHSITAVAILAQALHLRETPAAKGLFVASVRDLRSGSDHPALRDLAARALTEAWGDPGDLANIIQSLIKTGPGTADPIARAVAAWPRRPAAEELFGSAGADPVFDDRLLSTWLETSRVTDIDIERFLTAARSVLLRRAAGPAGAVPAPELRFWARVAQQCFTNEYVFAAAKDEADVVTQLHGAVAAALDAGEPIHALQLLAAAAFARLDSLPHAARLLNRSWPDDVAAVLVQQLLEPQQERELAAAIPRLTPVSDEVSRLVQAQYEENPYPRWIKAPPPATRMDERQRQNPFLASAFYPYGSGSGAGMEVLIAGGGTGRHVVDVAQRYPEAHFLAIDLSMASLGYAARKTRELGLTNVDYAQADILEFGGIGRSFDVIEASGVLHHLRDPFAGWRVLLSVLKPRGHMQVGLYSELARQQVVAARRFIAERGYRAGADDIRRARQDLIAATADGPLKAITDIGDFYTVSDCRDLLFHVQEHRLTLPLIKAFLQESGLSFLGFALDPAQRLAYATRFPDDKTLTDLDRWHLFETNNPETFTAMYQFWVRRNL
jgi:SAM-dependent methyltransferase